jgi:hypothetical protein
MITPLQAANLILADYEGSLTAESRLDINGCQSAIVNLPSNPLILLIRGSDERQDWVRNFTFVPEQAPGDSGCGGIAASSNTAASPTAGRGTRASSSCSVTAWAAPASRSWRRV